MRGADEAVRHMLQRMSSRSLAPTKLARALAGHVAKDTAESPETGPTGSQRDLGDRQIGIAQQGARLLDPPREQVAVWRDPERVLERTGEVRLRDAAYVGKPGHRPRLVRGGVDSILGSQEPAQQEWILAPRASIRQGFSHTARGSVPQLPHRVNRARANSRQFEILAVKTSHGTAIDQSHLLNLADRAIIAALSPAQLTPRARSRAAQAAAKKKKECGTCPRER